MKVIWKFNYIRIFSHNKPVGVDFSNGDTLNFSAEFSIQAEFNINIVGRTSGANFNINQTSQNLENTFWLGESNTIFFNNMSGVILLYPLMVTIRF